MSTNTEFLVASLKEIVSRPFVLDTSKGSDLFSQWNEYARETKRAAMEAILFAVPEYRGFRRVAYPEHPPVNGRMELLGDDWTITVGVYLKNGYFKPDDGGRCTRMPFMWRPLEQSP